jgi:hypothetical protein
MMLNHLGLDCLLPDDDNLIAIKIWTTPDLGCPSKLVSIKKQPKLEPKLVSALSETKRLFRLFRFYTETENFYVSIEPKQTGDQLKQFDMEHILVPIF